MCVIGGARGGCEVPAVDVIVAQVLYSGDRSVEGLEGMNGLCCEGCTFGDENALLAINGAEDGDSAAALVCRY